MPLTFCGIPDRCSGIHSKAWLNFGECVVITANDRRPDLLVTGVVVVEGVARDDSGCCDGLMTIFSNCVVCMWVVLVMIMMVITRQVGGALGVHELLLLGWGGRLGQGRGGY